MALDIDAVQTALREDSLDGWLLYDFHGSNPIARSLAGVNGGKMTTRRWYYFVPAKGQPRALVHAIERHTLDNLPGDTQIYAGRETLGTGLDALMHGVRRIAMEYSPENAIPYVGRVDAGTIEAIRRRGVEVVSSGDLVQRFVARWSEQALATHLEASRALYRVKDRAFEAIAARVGGGEPTTEHDVQQLMMGWFAEEGLVTDAPPLAASMENAGNPHYVPPATGSRLISSNELVLLDLWGKRDQPGAVYADITWVGFTGARVPDEFATAFAAVAAARDAAVSLVQKAARDGSDLRGWQVDRAARTVLAERGFGAHVLHRTGHNLGTEVHGNGVHMDDYETHDDRRILPGTGFTIEPGLYFDHFGVRTEINVFVGANEARVSGPSQAAIVTLG
jgi:Xaa-Pro aminopeptidase